MYILMMLSNWHIQCNRFISTRRRREQEHECVESNKHRSGATEHIHLFTCDRMTLIARVYMDFVIHKVEKESDHNSWPRANDWIMMNTVRLASERTQRNRKWTVRQNFFLSFVIGAYRLQSLCASVCMYSHSCAHFSVSTKWLRRPRKQQRKPSSSTIINLTFEAWQTAGMVATILLFKFHEKCHLLFFIVDVYEDDASRLPISSLWYKWRVCSSPDLGYAAIFP